MKNKKLCVKASFSLILFMLAVSCGYHIVGSKPLPFRSVTIHQVQNTTYEPRLEEKLHNALSQEFITQGIQVMASGGEMDLTATITTFQLGAIAHIDEVVQEQAITFQVNVLITGRERTIEFKTMQSPIRITFQTTGTVSEAVTQKERAIEKACSEIAREIISNMIIRYAS
jgi:hypothetical protein